MSRPTCVFVTGSASPAHAPTLHPERRGAERDDGRYDVLCGHFASFTVYTGDGPVTVCDRCLPFVARNGLTAADQVTVTRVST